MNEAAFDAICEALETGATWAEITERFRYADSESAYGSIRMMLMARGKRIESVMVRRIVDDPRARQHWERLHRKRSTA